MDISKFTRNISQLVLNSLSLHRKILQDLAVQCDQCVFLSHDKRFLNYKGLYLRLAAIKRMSLATKAYNYRNMF